MGCYNFLELISSFKQVYYVNWSRFLYEVCFWEKSTWTDGAPFTIKNKRKSMDVKRLFI